MGPLHRLRWCLSHLYGLTARSGTVNTGCCVSRTSPALLTLLLFLQKAASAAPLQTLPHSSWLASPSSRPPAAGRAQKGTDPCLFSSEPLLNLY